jgi:hypothetical protein
MRSKLDGCLTGSRLARDRVVRALTAVAIPGALDSGQFAPAATLPAFVVSGVDLRP